uniref:Uncharacterized protein n=1 Tax=Siphoviridae sp. ctdau33 TaxID=2827902 RepID=A0A8S5S722_9CAUD|nr:MAG TPA: hypothetical protein [Siphoviridae sp. ctdau33]
MRFLWRQITRRNTRNKSGSVCCKTALPPTRTRG